MSEPVTLVAFELTIFAAIFDSVIFVKLFFILFFAKKWGGGKAHPATTSARSLSFNPVNPGLNYVFVKVSQSV